MPTYTPAPDDNPPPTPSSAAVRERLAEIRVELGANPSGTHADVEARLAAIDPAGA